MENKKDYRIEKDSMGEMSVPREALWGAQTQRAVENFPISPYRFPRLFIRALGMVKYAAATANIQLGLLDPIRGKGILDASLEVMNGTLDDQFVLDIFQTGSGTSTNMNANEVIAHRAQILIAASTDSPLLIHPNDHVNMGQSSNDVIPSCMHISIMESLTLHLLPALRKLEDEFRKKAVAFDHIVKIGRTHLQDATPVRLGQEFGGYASMIQHSIHRIEKDFRDLLELALGGTAVGTGINANPRFIELTIQEINKITRLNFFEAQDHFEAQGGKDAVVEISGTLKTLAASLLKIAGDIKWMGAGPYGNLGEINIPPVQPGSSIMPGKVNPVIIESLQQVAVQVIGSDAVVTLCGLSGNFELNTMMPVMAFNILSSIQLLTNGINVFADKCISRITANEARCKEMMEKSLAMVTALNPHVGYDAAAEIAKEAFKTGKTLRQVILEKNILPPNEIDKILDPYSLTVPQ